MLDPGQYRVDPTTNTVIVLCSHFSQYAIFASAVSVPPSTSEAPSQTIIPVPTVTVTETPASSEPIDNPKPTTNWGLITGIIAAVVIVAAIIVIIVIKRKSTV
jgi:hypothetical protein